MSDDDLDQEAKLNALASLTSGPEDSSDQLYSQDSSDKIAPSPASPSNLESVLRGASQGATLGWGDEASGALGALFPSDTDEAMNRSYSDRYNNIANDIRQSNEQAQTANPRAYLSGEIGGGLGTAGALPFAGGGGSLANIAKVAGSLAGYGAVQGAGSANGNDRLKAAYSGAKNALEAPLDAAQSVAQNLSQGDVGGSASSTGILALSLLPFALKGTPVNEFVTNRADSEISKLVRDAKAAIKSGDFEQGQSIINKLQDESAANSQASTAYQSHKFNTSDPEAMRSFTDSQFKAASLAGKQDGAANFLKNQMEYGRDQIKNDEFNSSVHGKDLLEKLNYLSSSAEEQNLLAEAMSPQTDAGRIHEIYRQMSDNPTAYNRGNIEKVALLDKNAAKIKAQEANAFAAQNKNSVNDLRPGEFRSQDYGSNVVPPNVFQSKLNALKSSTPLSSAGESSLPIPKSSPSDVRGFSQPEIDQINENLKAGRSAFQNEDYTPQQHAQDIFTNSLDSSSPDAELNDSLQHLNELAESNPKYSETAKALQNLIAQRRGSRTVVPSDLFQAKLNALKKLQQVE